MCFPDCLGRPWGPWGSRALWLRTTFLVLKHNGLKFVGPSWWGFSHSPTRRWSKSPELDPKSPSQLL